MGREEGNSKVTVLLESNKAWIGSPLKDLLWLCLGLEQQHGVHSWPIMFIMVTPEATDQIQWAN